MALNKTALLYIFCLFIIVRTDAQQSNKARKPNIIFILADDLGYGDLGCYGQQKIETPHFDKLAEQGLRFTQFYSASTVCAPARASFFTGLHTGHAPVRGNKSFQPEGQAPLSASAVTFTNRLRENGYINAAFGKWGLGFITTSGDPNKQGFDLFYGYNCQSLAHHYYPDHLWKNHEKILLNENLKDNKIYSADLIHKEALEFISNSTDAPFFLYLPYTLPHAEVITPHDSTYFYYIKKFNEKPDTVKRRYDGRFLEPYPHAMFASMVARLDRYVGEIVKTVNENGLAENTLIIFTSDNGPHREGGGDPEFFNSNGIYRGIKRDLYEGGIRVPFIAYWPGKIRGGTTAETGVLWDMFPTFLELAGIENKNNIDGLSLVPTLLQKGKQKQHEYLYWEFHENNGRQAVRYRNWKAVRLEVSKIPDPPVELYDLDSDPSETKNIAEKHPEVVQKLKMFFENAHLPNNDWPLLFKERK